MPATQNETKCCTIHVDPSVKKSREWGQETLSSSSSTRRRRQIFGNTFDKFPCECRAAQAFAKIHSTIVFYFWFYLVTKWKLLGKPKWRPSTSSSSSNQFTWYRTSSAGTASAAEPTDCLSKCWRWQVR